MPEPVSTAVRSPTSNRGPAESPRPTRVLIVGGGYVGMYTALGLRRLIRSGEVAVTVVEPRSYMTYQPFLPEAAAGSIQPRHTVVPLRKTLRGVDVISGTVTGVRHVDRVAIVQPLAGDPREVGYDVLVLAPGSVARTLPIPGLAEAAVGFRTIEEAISLRNGVLACLDAAQSTDDPDLRRRMLTFVFVGGGYAGVEALAELEDMARYATRYHPDVSPADLRFVLVEASDRILPEVGLGLAEYTRDQLERRGIDVRLRTRLESALDGQLILSDGTELSAHTLVWTAGVRAHPMLADTDLPLDAAGRLVCSTTLTVPGCPGVFGAGDAAAVPDLTRPGELCSPSAQHAVRQASVLAGNIVALVRGEPLREYEHSYAGSVASLGLYRGVAQVYGIRLRGLPAWFMHRTYHVARMPTLQRKVAVVADWTLALFFQRDITSLGSLTEPRQAFTSAAADSDSAAAAEVDRAAAHGTGAVPVGELAGAAGQSARTGSGD